VTAVRKLNARSHGYTLRPGPFLKWAGGKSQLLPVFDRYIPPKFGRYFEPFVGGGAVFFHLLPPYAMLSDLNEELINCYQVIRNDVENLIKTLQTHRNEPDYFYDVRTWSVADLTVVERAARLIFLNKTCFNGLYRVNSRGQFNVPFGKYKSPRICDADNLRAVSLSLANTEINCQSFEQIVHQAQKGDFIYFDPPYQPLSKTANFTGYTKNAFRSEDQERLALTFRKLSRRGCYVMLSNSDSEYVRDLYSKFHIEVVKAHRAINCKGDRRGVINELLIMNY
jgi:DNA adenine methylase